jgi:hypothetical protein
MDSATIIVVHLGMDNEDDYSMLKKKVKFCKQNADNVGVGFDIPGSISSLVVLNVPKTIVGKAGQVVAQVFVIGEIKARAPVVQLNRVSAL